MSMHELGPETSVVFKHLGAVLTNGTQSIQRTNTKFTWSSLMVGWNARRDFPSVLATYSHQHRQLT